MKKNILNLTSVFVSTSIFIAILFLVNILGAKFFWKIDLTSQKKYSLSSSTKNLLSTLDEPVMLTAYFSKSVNTDLTEKARYLENFLQEMSSYSNGHLKLEFIDPSNLENMEKQKLQYEGVSPLQLNTRQSDKFEAAIGYLGVVIRYLDKKEVIPALIDESKAEYTLYSKIASLISYKTSVVGLLKLINDDPQEKNYSFESFEKALSQTYEMKNVTISEKNFSADFDILVVLAGDREISADELLALDQAIISGKKIVFGVSKLNIDMSKDKVEEGSKELTQYLSKLGITFGDKLIYDESNARIQFQTWILPMTVNYPYYIGAKDFNRTDKMVNGLAMSIIPFATSISSNKLSTEYLIRSSRDSYEYTANSISPTVKIEPSPNSLQGPFDLALHITGKAESGFKNDKKLKNIKGDGEIDVVIFSSAKIFDDQIFSANGPLILNVIDGVLGNTDLVSIRNKNVESPPLVDLSDLNKRIVKYFNILFIPIILIIIGFVRYRSRKSKESDIYEF